MARTARTFVVLLLAAAPCLGQGVEPVRAREGLVVAQNATAAAVGTQILRDGGNAVDAAVATAFALAVTHPIAGNIGGGGFLLHRRVSGETLAYDFRETAPTGSSPTMFLSDGGYDRTRHHQGHRAVGVPGTVAGLHLAWKERGRLPWARLVAPAVALARDGFIVSDGLARSLEEVLPSMAGYPASVAQFTKNGVPYRAGDRLSQLDLARTLERIARDGPAGFYEGETAALIEKEMKAGGGLMGRSDLASYRALRRDPVKGTYRGCEIVGMPLPSSGGVGVVEMLNILEGYDLAKLGAGSASHIHLVVEAMRRAYADRARYLGDPEADPHQPIDRLLSKEYAAELRRGIREDRASKSEPDRFEWPPESSETTHVSVVDRERNAVALTYTLEGNYGSKIVVPGAGFLLNNEMGDFNAGPGLTDATGLVGTKPNLAAPQKRMLSSMAPTILIKDGALFMVLGSPGGRKILNAVLLTILNVLDFGMNVQQAVDFPRFHHQWLPDVILHEKWGFSPDTMEKLAARGHQLSDAWPASSPTAVQAIVVREGVLEGGYDRRTPDAGAVGY
jgi:gamma-glutamyltranspeptidase/glutathione hydrolase